MFMLLQLSNAFMGCLRPVYLQVHPHIPGLMSSQYIAQCMNVLTLRGIVMGLNFKPPVFLLA